MFAAARISKTAASRAVAKADALRDGHAQLSKIAASVALNYKLKNCYWGTKLSPLSCPECGGQMEVVSFIEPPQADVIEAILKHCGLWQSRSPRAPPEVHEVMLELDPAFTGHSLDAPNEVDESQELTYVDIDTFLANF